MEGAIENIEFLSRSRARTRIFAEVAESGEVTKSDLVDRLDCSRATVRRNLDALVDRGFLDESGRLYSLTRQSSYIAPEYFDFLETVQVVNRLEPFLRWVDPASLDIDVREFRDADLFQPQDGDPYSMINHHVSRIKEADTLRALVPFTGLHAYEAGHERVTEHGADMELVVEPSVAETHLEEPGYSELTAELAEVDSFRTYRYDGQLPLAVAVLDEYVQIMASEGDDPRAMIETVDESVRDWAREYYREYRDMATRII